MSVNTARFDIADYIADIVMAAVFACQHNGGGRPQWSRYAGLTDPTAAAAFDLEIQTVLKASRQLRVALAKACRVGPDGELDSAARAHFLELLEHELGAAPNHARRSIEALLGLDGHLDGHPNGHPNGHPRRSDVRLSPPGLVAWRRDPVLAGRRPRHGRRHKVPRSVKRVWVPVFLLNLIIAATMAFGPVAHVAWGARLPVGDPLELAISAFAVWALSFIPGWLLVRFLERRAGALWDEYVVHLHRLGVDDHGNLPEPPRTSAYYARWRDGGGLSKRGLRNLYQEKFDAYYGKSVSRSGANGDRPVKSEALFPVFLCTAVMAVGWTATLYDSKESLTGISDDNVWSILPFAYLGAYVYFLQMLMRRYFQADLRAGAYVSGFVRIIGALIVAAVLHAAGLTKAPAEAAIAVAFAVGWFPDVGMRWLLRIAFRWLKGPVPSVYPAYPLNRLDGLNLWYETRLLEEGIEDLQNLATAKLVDVVLHTRVPVARLVDWVDQALLLIHLPAEPADVEEGGSGAAGPTGGEDTPHVREVLRSCGVRSATGLKRALGPGRDSEERERLFKLLETKGISQAAAETLYQVISADPRLNTVENWQEGDARARSVVAPGR